MVTLIAKRGHSEPALIWLALLTALAVAAYRVAVALQASAGPDAGAGLSLSQDDWITNGLILWSLVFLAAATLLLRGARRHERELARIIDSVSPDVLLVVTPDRKITLCNPAVQAMFGVTPESVVGQTTDLLYLDRRKPGAMHEVHDALQACGFHVGQAVGRRPDGTTFPLEIVTGGLEGRMGAVVLVRDITERKRAESELLRAHEALEASYRRLQDAESLRDNLVHMVVHDIKHSVSGVSTSLELLDRALGPGGDPQVKTLLEGAQGFAGDVLTMVRSLLDISRMEAGQMPLDLVPCDMAAVAREAVATVRAIAREKRIDIVLPEMAAPAAADRDIMVRVMANLLGNAVRFAPEGSRVEVRMRVEAGMLRVEILDDGPGVPPAYHQKIFEKFGRVAMRREGADQSTGLGLTFCKLAIEAHGGQIGIVSPSPESGRGAGSLFWFTLSA